MCSKQRVETKTKRYQVEQLEDLIISGATLNGGATPVEFEQQRISTYKLH
jgi:hypothetical protein